MLTLRRITLTAGLLLMAGVLWSGALVRAGDKKGVKASAPLLSKAEELKEDDEKDTKFKNSPCKIYAIKLVAGKTYQIDLKSKEFDAVLRLENSAGKQVAINDDFEPGVSLDSRIVYQVPKTGEYKIIATCLDGKAGAFTLTVVETDAPAAANSQFQGPTSALKLKDGNANFIGELTNKGGLAFNRHYKVFTVQLEKGKIYRIDQRTGGDPKFDSLLFLEDADGTQLAVDDDSGGDLDARIVYKIAKTGTYRVVATTLVEKQTGKFILEFSAPDAAEAKEAEFKFRVTHYATLAPAQRKNVMQEVDKRLKDKGEGLTLNELGIALQFGIEAELEDADLARDLYKKYIDLFSDASDKKVAAVSVQNFKRALKNLEKVGKEFDITGMKLDGKEFNLKDLKGKVVLVDFWGTWCGPCVAEMPNLLRAYQKYHSKGFEVIGVAQDKNDEIVTEFMDQRGLPWGCINVEDSRAMIKKHGVNSYPHPVLVGPDGRVVSLRARGPQLERLLERLLVEKK